MNSVKKFSLWTAIAVVVANMVGTGIFTSLGFQLLDIHSPFVLMMLWVVGGVTALCGALTYAELSARLPRSGGEYNFLSQIWHPGAGFVSGWVSATIGFAAPIALAAMTFGAYLSAVFPEVDQTLSASLLVVALTILHCISRAASGGTQSIMTALKVLLILVFCFMVAIFSEQPQTFSLAPQIGDQTLVLSSAFAVSLIYVNYGYTGWNAATYITNEIEDPQKNLPIILISGTLIVMVLYLLLNYFFLFGAPIEALEGKIEIGVIVAEQALGEVGGSVMGGLLSLMLISTVSAMVLAGPRVLQVIGEDFKIFSFLSTVRQGVPIVAILFQSAIALGFILSSTFESVLVFAGFVMGLNTVFTVAGVFVLRFRKIGEEGIYRTWGYPVTPLIYLGLTIWTLTYILINRPEEGLNGLALIGTGLVVYYLSSRKGMNTRTPEQMVGDK
ncbi:amino acid permease [Pseudomonadales bacterium]|jgi:APA family basic amino acid/polyamine antiporter|nr:amino acid permease [Gammaproteobacteria bacterium]MDA8880607.1 amino acid permease [Pseudomonadales bacterium]MDC0995654.1 amino acid permease [Pseudomonadales bacterium]MDC1017721.1 amino acid permease [Pseudomonadales bacterium]MDC1083631.1 amino acid permease [Pseudomonadales bacterium]